MNVLLFGATGMVGAGALRECLLDPQVERVLAVGRSPLGQHHPKLQEIVQKDLADITSLSPQLQGFDACFFCLGISSLGMSQEAYEHITYNITLSIAEVLVRLNPRMCFVYVSGAGTDSTEKGRTMWARVKGRTENALLRLPFASAYMLRPGVIQPVHGVRSKTRLYQFFYTLTAPLLPLLRTLFPGLIITTEELGRAMLILAMGRHSQTILENRDIRALLNQQQSAGR